MSIDRYRSKSNRAGAQRGLSLVEIMVGVTIAMIGIVIIFQMLATSEERKRSVSSGSDTQVSAIIAVTSLERDVREAGYGFSSAAHDTTPPPTGPTPQNVTPVMGCMVNAYDHEPTRAPNNKHTFRLTPILIEQGGGPDKIIVLRGNGPVFPAAHVFTASTDTTKKTRGHGGMSARDYALIARTAPDLQCVMVEITEIDNAYTTCTDCTDGVTIQHMPSPTSYFHPSYNPDGTTSTVSREARHNDPTPTLTFTNGFIFTLGNGARRNIWELSNGKLLVTNDLLYVDVDGTPGNDPLEVAEGIIDLQAEYGVDANNNGRIEATEWTTVDPATPAAWANVLAVRMAILLRAGQYEREPKPGFHVTNTIPTWSGSFLADGVTPNPASALTVTNLDGSVGTAPPASGQPFDDWRNYRYRVYETVVPLRNILWGSNIPPS